MKLLDYWVLYLYHFVCFFKKDDFAWLSARLYLSLFVGAFVMLIICVVALLGSYCVGDGLLELIQCYILPIYLGSFVLSGVIIDIYYSKYKKLSEIEESYNMLNKKRKLKIKIIIYFFEVTVLLGSFICFRLVVADQIKWW